MEMKLALIRPGEFPMGSETNSWGHHRNESPVHRVRITKPFYMGICEVTRAQYDAVMGTATAGNASNQPAANVSWREATNFCGRAAQKTGRRVRLPSEAEWEYACRAGTTTPWSFGDADGVEEAIRDHAWYGQEAGGGLKDAGGKKPNGWGLYDMHGSVSEWCLDRFGADYYLLSPTDDPAGPETGVFRVMRGGSVDNLRRRNVELARSARRAWGHPDLRILQRGMNHMCIGFRVVVEAGGGETVTDKSR
jgi:formylglycine-generating enzyme required for sulfatase activity